MSDRVGYAFNDDVAELRLDDGKVNAMSRPFFDALNGALDRAEKDQARAVVIAGRAGVFSAGLNLKVLPTLEPEELKNTLINFGHTMLRVYNFPIPTVAAITGHAIAGGFVLMAACDLRFAAEGPHRIHLNEVALGLTLPTWATIIAESAVPPQWQTETILHARPCTPEEALARGIIQRVVSPADKIVDEARDAAKELTALDTATYAKVKAAKREVALERALAFVEIDASRLDLNKAAR